MFRTELSDGEKVRQNASCKGKCVNALDSDWAQPAARLPCIYHGSAIERLAHIDRVLMKHIINKNWKRPG